MGSFQRAVVLFGIVGAGCSGGEDLRSVAQPLGACPTHQGVIQCGNGCAAVEVDPENCGGCGTRCAQGETCAGGICTHHGPTQSIIRGDPASWSELGPALGGRIDGLVVQSGTTPTWVIGSPGGGPWRKLETDTTWTFPVRSGLAEYSMMHHEWDIATAGRMYAVTWNGLYATTDDGTTWTNLLQTGGAPGGLLPYQNDVIDPKPFSQYWLDSTHRLVVTSFGCYGIYYSFDGSTFTQSYPFSGGLSNPDNCIGNIAIDRGSKRVYFSTLASGNNPAHVYRSANPWANGSPSLTWQAANTGLPSNVGTATLISVATGSTDHLLAQYYTSGLQTYETTDGQNWTLKGTLSSGGVGARPLVFAGSNELFLGALNAYYSLDLGATWTQIPNSGNVHADVRSIYADSGLGKVYTGTDGAGTGNQLNLTESTWAGPGNAPGSETGMTYSGLTVWQMYTAAVVPPVNAGDPRRVFVGAQDNGMNCTDNAGVSGWNPAGIATGDAWSVRVSPSNPNRAYSWNEGSGWSFFRTDVARTDHCSSPPYMAWNGYLFPSGYATQPKYWTQNSMAIHPTNDLKVYFATTSGIVITTDGGTTYEPVRTLPGGAVATALYIDSAGVIYAGTEGAGAYSSSDDGVTWSQWGLNTGSPAIVLGVNHSTAASGTDWMATTSGLYRRLSGGSWTLVTGGNGYVVNDVAVDPNCATRVYCAFGFAPGRQQHRGGIEVTSDNGNTWSSITSGVTIHETPVASIEVDPATPSWLYASSYGRGLWKYDWGGSLPTCSP